MTSVLVLNASYEPLHRVSMKHAIKMIVREVAVIEESHEDKKFGDFPVPLVLRLVRYVKMHWRASSPRWSKKRLMQRDNSKCGYCAKNADTVEHIVPRILGGQTTWKNTVAACFKCNSKKGSRTLEQSGMKLLFQPYEPSWQEITG